MNLLILNVDGKNHMHTEIYDKGAYGNIYGVNLMED